MTTVNIGNNNSTYSANISDVTYNLRAGDTIDSKIGIDATAAASGREFRINGEIDAVSVGLYVGAEAESSPAVTIKIGQTGNIHAVKSAIVTYADHSTISNAGSLNGGLNCFMLESDRTKVTNSGVINGDVGLTIHGSNNSIINTGLISGGTPVEFESGDHNIVRNSGTIAGSYYAVIGGTGDETIINTGKMYGDVGLGDGGDTFISRGGFVTGIVNGGLGDDAYVLGKGRAKIAEDMNSGHDSVKSSQSFTLGDNFEDLTLAGKANLNGRGNALDNILTGNSGKNHLFGNAGIDELFGGHGKDRLTGGAGADVFDFKPNGDKEIITDFQNGVDHIAFYSGTEVAGFAKLLSEHVHEVDGNLVIDANGTEMIINGLHKADFTIDDFI